VWSDDPARALVRPGLALLRGRVPLVAWSEQPPGAPTATTVRVALWNGPSTPPALAARASIAGCAFDGTQATLSATGCFAIAAGRAAPHPGLVPFDLTSELWSDGALKRRWVALPDGQSLTTPPTGAWTAPPGTMILKEFAYETTPGAAHTRRVMETRFLINGASTDAWKGFSFRWRPDGSDADLLTDTDTVAWPLDNGARHAHVYPSRTQCTRCHHPSNGPLLGLRTAQLARRFDYDGIIADQLETLASLGAIPAPPGPSRAAPITSPHDTSAPLELRVRGYLAANCSHCHNPTGERPTRDFRWETPLERTLLCGPDAEVVAGDPASSVLVQRISARPGMPPLATLATDPLVIDIATRWIAGETNCQ
jgi:cytochrome c553